jgi:superfamily I DNA/RNA helicase/RecB family exonuclease
VATLNFDPEQLQAIEHERGPVLVRAGAGTGKTTVLVHRMARLIQRGLARPEEILAITYSNNAADELRQRVRRLLGPEFASRLRATTFHAYGFGLLKRAGRGFEPLDDKDLWVLLRRRISQLPLRHFIRAANLGEFLRDLLEFFSRCHDEVIAPDDYDRYLAEVEAGKVPLPRVSKSSATALSRDETIERCREIAATFRATEELLRSKGLGTFGHMISDAVRLLRADAGLRNHERQNARFLLIDEFQDANLGQIEMAQLIAGDDGNVFAVGDPDQAIYHFRGASSAAFDEFLRRYPAAKQITLIGSQRSTRRILGAAHAVVRRNPGSHSELVSRREERAKVDGAALVSLPLELVVCPSREAEAQEVVKEIERLRSAENCRDCDFAVIYRQHSHRAEVAEALRQRNIPFAVLGLDILETAEARDLLACLRAVLSSGDSIALLRVAALPQFAIDGTDLRGRMRRNPGVALAAILQQMESGSPVLKTLEQMRRAARAGEMLASAVVERVLDGFALPRSAMTQTFCDFVAAWEEKLMTETGELGEFLEYLDYFVEAGGAIPLNDTTAEDSVQLMTAHAAKGLEFRHVFILRASKSSFPASFRERLFEFPAGLRAMADTGGARELHEQEERRLFYVAMTRARDSLTISAKPGAGAKDPSPPGYLRELMNDASARDYWRCHTADEARYDLHASAALTTPLAGWMLEAPAFLAEPLVLSATGIDMYRRCPLQFKISREWRMEAKPSAAVQFGAAMHAALKLYGERVSEGRSLFFDEEVLNFFRQALLSEAIEDPLQRRLYEQKGLAELRNFLGARASGTFPEILSAERSFEEKVAGMTIRGRVDRLDRVGGNQVAIVDYKTGRPRSQEDADESLQLSLYALAAREQWKLEPEQLIFYNLETNTGVVTTRTSAQLEEAAHVVEEVAHNIMAGEFDAKTGFHCNWCAFRNLCPAQEKTLYNIAAAPQTIAAKVN